MTFPSKLSLELVAVLVSVPTCVSLAQTQTSSATSRTPIASSAQTPVPALVPYSGIAVDRDGHALSTELGLTFLIYKDQTGGEPLFTETQRVLPDLGGRYTVHLGASMSGGLPIGLFSTGEARWLEVQIAGEPAQQRSLLASVPYALKAADATTLGGLPASAFLLAGTNRVQSTAVPAITPDASSSVTTPGGLANYLAKFNGTSAIADSIIYDNGANVGIGIVPTGNAKLDLNGNMILRGNMTVSRSGNATASKGYPSFGFQFFANAYNSSTGSTVNPNFTIQSEPKGNNTSSPAATLNILYATSGAPAETGLSINSNGTINFAPAQVFPGGSGVASSFCVAVGGGFGNGGTTFVGPSFSIPAAGGCTQWSGFTKTGTTVVLMTSGAACLSSDAKKLTLSVSSADPSYLGTGNLAADYVQLTRASTTGSFLTGSDQGEFSGSAAQITCSSSLLQLNENND